MPLLEVVDENAYIVYQSSPFNGMTTSGGQYPATLYYYFSKDVRCSEDLFPFIKTCVSFKNYPIADFGQVGETVQFEDFNSVVRYREIYGDSTLIYKGHVVPSNDRTEFPKLELDAGQFSTANSGKWYKTSTDDFFTYTSGGDTYELEGVLTEITSTYNVALAGDGLNYDAESFNCIAIDTVNQSFLVGEGTYTKVEWVYNVSLDIWQQEVTTIKNSQRTVPISDTGLDGFFLRIYGRMWKNDVLDFTGAAVFSTSGFISPRPVITNWGLTFQDTYRLFWDNRRARVVTLTTSNPTPHLLTNLPRTSDYENSTQSYTNIFNKINNDANELINSTTTENYIFLPTRSEYWVKLNNDFIPTYRFVVSGTATILLPATKPVTDTYLWVDETYSQVGSTYIRDAENRDTAKEITVYFNDAEPIQGRLQVVLKNPYDLQSQANVTNQES